MKSRLLSLTAIALVGLAVMGLATPAHAQTLVTYSTVGTFASTMSPTFVAPGIDITFDPITLEQVGINPPPLTGISLGDFDTSATTAPSLVGVNDTFTLEIFQSDPGPTDPTNLTLVGTLQGSLSSNATTAFVQFTGFTPSGLIGTFESPGPGPLITFVNYFITEADNGVLGKANIVPPSVNEGISSVEGALSLSVIPEPASIVMAGTAIPLGLLMMLRRRTKGNVAG